MNIDSKLQPVIITHFSAGGNICRKIHCFFQFRREYPFSIIFLSGMILIQTCSKNSHQKFPGRRIFPFLFTLIIRAKI